MVAPSVFAPAMPNSTILKSRSVLDCNRFSGNWNAHCVDGWTVETAINDLLSRGAYCLRCFALVVLQQLAQMFDYLDSPLTISMPCSL